MLSMKETHGHGQTVCNLEDTASAVNGFLKHASCVHRTAVLGIWNIWLSRHVYLISDELLTRDILTFEQIIPKLETISIGQAHGLPSPAGSSAKVEKSSIQYCEEDFIERINEALEVETFPRPLSDTSHDQPAALPQE